MDWLKRLFAVGLIIAVLAYGALFSIQNDQLVALNFVIVPAMEGTVAFWVLASFCVGGVMGLLFSSTVIMMNRAKVVALKRKLRAREQEQSKLHTPTLN